VERQQSLFRRVLFCEHVTGGFLLAGESKSCVDETKGASNGQKAQRERMLELKKQEDNEPITCSGKQKADETCNHPRSIRAAQRI
jgi:hypothetical protein